MRGFRVGSESGRGSRTLRRPCSSAREGEEQEGSIQTDTDASEIRTKTLKVGATS
jgi:hypothetical protein